MIDDYKISLATPDDIPGILTLQEPNLVERGGGLSVRQTADWYRHAIFEKSIVVGRRNGKVLGYVLGTSLAAKAHVPMIQSRRCCVLSRRHAIAIYMVRSAWPRLSAEKASRAHCSKNYKPT